MANILYQGNLGSVLNPAKVPQRLCPEGDIIDELIKVIPWVPVRESALASYGPSGGVVNISGVEFINTDAGTDAGEAVSGSYDLPSGEVAPSMGRIATDAMVDALTDENSPEAVSAVIAGRIAAIRGVIGQALIVGDGGTGFGGITGLASVCPTSSVDYYINGGDAAVTAAEVADLIYYKFRKAGRPDVLVTHPAGLISLEPILPRGSRPVMVPALGYCVPSWNGIPILRSEHVPLAGPTTDLYALKMGGPCGVYIFYPASSGRGEVTVRRMCDWDNDVVKYRVSASLGFAARPGGGVVRLGNWR